MRGHRRARSIWYFSLTIALGVLFLPLFGSVESLAGQDDDEFWLDLEQVASGLDQPLYVTDPGDQSDRLFVLEKPGVIKVIQDGAVLPEPFLDISANVESSGSEQGLLGLAFHPDYQQNGYFYITYSPEVTEWRLERYEVPADDPNRANPESATMILSVDHPGDTHYGGMVTFDSDGYLWTSLGDGGAGAYDPLGDSQNPETLLGSILRIDVDSEFPYAIPPDNPFVDMPGHRPEIWAYGLRNPWRFSFDRLTGDMFIGDVGQESWEEVDYEPADSTGGRNYGWPELEGLQCTPVSPDCDPGQFTPPILQYGRSQGCAVTGGYVYREDPASPIYGTYIFADFCNGSIWTVDPDGDGGWDSQVRLFTTMNISSFGEDANGGLYLTDLTGGAVYRLRASNDPPVPVLSQTEPAAMPAGGVGCTLHLRGWNFLSTATVLVNGDPRETEYINNSWLTIDVTPDDLAAPASLNVTVANDETGNLESEPFRLEIQDAGLATQALYDRWSRTDEPVASGDVSRTWMWGPTGMTCPTFEPYADAPGGMRVVQYFDKSRMEVNDPAGDANSPWYVTNGLLATEMITGQRQIGDTMFEPAAPSQIGVAGDLDDTTGPAYATFSGLTGPVAGRSGEPILERINRDGTRTTDESLAERGVQYGYFDDVTGHNIADPFWSFMNSEGLVLENGVLGTGSLFLNPFFATGRPITEAYWANVKVGGVEKDVLVQCFERRCLTYTPSNDPGWQVEAGNVGQHYYRWVRRG